MEGKNNNAKCPNRRRVILYDSSMHWSLILSFWHAAVSAFNFRSGLPAGLAIRRCGPRERGKSIANRKLASAKHRFSHMTQDSSKSSPIPGLESPRIRLFDSMAGVKRDFEPFVPGKVKMYTCGPTVYDSAHIGNFRAFIFYDILKRMFLYFGYDVDHVCNLTDIDDKILTKALQSNISRCEVTDEHIRQFLKDIKALNIMNATRYPKVSDHLPQIIEMVEKLKQKGYAYQAGDSVYFRVNAFSSYNQFAAGGGSATDANVSSSDAVTSMEDDPYGEKKASFRDFALWKGSARARLGGPPASRTPQPLNPEAPSEAELVKRGLAWNSSLGCGRPGWHIECSAIIHSTLGESIDIHCGGIDLQFPHHANEIAQSEALSGKRLANYWVHNGFVIFNHTKMSKSLNNFCTLSDVSKSDIENRAIRFALLSSQYRNPVNFSPETVKQGVKTIKAIDLLVSKLKKIIKNPPIKQVPEPEPDFVEYPKEAIEYVDNSGPSQETLKLFTNVTATANKYITSFEEAICDDIDTPAALKSLFGFVNFMQKALCVRSDDFTPDEATIAINCLQQMDKVFGVFFPSEASGSQKIKEFQIAPNSECNDMRLIEASDAPPEVAELLRRRAKAKESRDFAASDQIRAQLKQLGYAVVDNRDGSVDLFEIIS